FGTGNATTAGASGGEAMHTLTTGELASHNHPVFLNDPGHTHSVGGGGFIFANSTPLRLPSGRGPLCHLAPNPHSSTTGHAMRDSRGAIRRAVAARPTRPQRRGPARPTTTCRRSD